MKLFTVLSQKLDKHLAKSVRRTIDQKDEKIALGVVNRFARGSIRLQKTNGGLLTRSRLDAEIRALTKR